MSVLNAYLIFGIVMAVLAFAYSLYEDLAIGPDHKFGANFYDRRKGVVVNRLSLGMVLLFAVPVINILWIGFWMNVYCYSSKHRKNKLNK